MTAGMHRAARLVRRYATGRNRSSAGRLLPGCRAGDFRGSDRPLPRPRLWGSDPLIRREATRGCAAMRANGTLRRDIAYETCIDTDLARRAIAATA